MEMSGNNLKICDQVNATKCLDDVHESISTCLDQVQKAEAKSFFNGTKTVIRKMCRELEAGIESNY